MGALLTNATMTYSRSSYSSTTKVTSAPTSFGSVRVHVFPVHALKPMLLPEAALTSDIVARCDSGTDIQDGDLVNSLVLDNGSRWPSATPNPNESLEVVWIAESTPGIPELAYRDAFVKRSELGGPTQA